MGQIFAENACHMPMAENPEKLAETILRIHAEDEKGETEASGIDYRSLSKEEIGLSLFSSFERRQTVNKCYRMENGEWAIREAPFIDEWSGEDYEYLVKCLKKTVEAGGFVTGAFQNGILKGFVSVEGEPFGSHRQYLDVSSLHVSAELRGSGIGKKLFSCAADWAIAHGAEKLYISSHSAVETQAFYEAMGCVDAEEINEAHRNAEPFDRQLEYSLKE